MLFWFHFLVRHFGMLWSRILVVVTTAFLMEVAGYGVYSLFATAVLIVMDDMKRRSVYTRRWKRMSRFMRWTRNPMWLRGYVAVLWLPSVGFGGAIGSVVRTFI